MRRRDLIAAALVAGAATPALASGGGETKKAVGQYVDLSPVALPVIDGGKLRNYVFVVIRLNLTAHADPTKYRAKEPYFRDALVRLAHRRPFTVAGDWTRLDEAALKAALLREAGAVAGPGVVAGVQVVSATPQRRTGMQARG
jgi:hypothetical protein